MLRREMLTQAIPAFAGLGVLPFIPNLSELSDDELMAQVGLMRELDGDSGGAERA